MSGWEIQQIFSEDFSVESHRNKTNRGVDKDIMARLNRLSKLNMEKLGKKVMTASLGSSSEPGVIPTYSKPSKNIHTFGLWSFHIISCVAMGRNDDK